MPNETEKHQCQTHLSFLYFFFFGIHLSFELWLLTGVFRGSPAPVGGVPAERDLQQAIQSKKSILITGMPRLIGGKHHIRLNFTSRHLRYMATRYKNALTYTPPSL